MAVSYTDGQVLRSTTISRVLYYLGREQPYTVWVRWNGVWKVALFHVSESGAINRAIAYEEGSPE